MSCKQITDKGGAISLSSGASIAAPGGAIILQNSTFLQNTADLDNGGVLTLGEFCNATIEGDDNIFEENECGAGGGVLAATENTWVVVHGGNFSNNESKYVREEIMNDHAVWVFWC